MTKPVLKDECTLILSDLAPGSGEMSAQSVIRNVTHYEPGLFESRTMIELDDEGIGDEYGLTYRTVIALRRGLLRPVTARTGARSVIRRLIDCVTGGLGRLCDVRTRGFRFYATGEGESELFFELDDRCVR